jgi:hypothetical protein
MRGDKVTLVACDDFYAASTPYTDARVSRQLGQVLPVRRARWGSHVVLRTAMMMRMESREGREERRTNINDSSIVCFFLIGGLDESGRDEYRG